MTMQTDRVARSTARQVNEQIEAQARERVCDAARRPASIPRRLRQLDREWDIERVLEANAAALALAGFALAAVHDRRWLALPATVAAFLLQHAVQGWCPPLPVFRRMGVRTRREIDAERTALKALRGDFVAPPTGPGRAEAAFTAASR